MSVHEPAPVFVSPTNHRLGSPLYFPVFLGEELLEALITRKTNWRAKSIYKLVATERGRNRIRIFGLRGIRVIENGGVRPG